MTEALTGWTRPDTGALFVVSGASGSGKSTLLRGTFARVPGLEFSVSATTRAPRPGERDGVDYHFVHAGRFAAMRDGGELLEHAQVYDRAYGTPRAPVEAALREGRSIVLDIDVQGARQVRAVLPEAVTVFILPPDRDTLRRRLAGRGDAPELIERRMAQADQQLAAAPEYDYLVLNEVLEVAQAQLDAVVIAELSRRARRESWLERVGAGEPG